MKTKPLRETGLRRCCKCRKISSFWPSEIAVGGMRCPGCGSDALAPAKLPSPKGKKPPTSNRRPGFAVRP